MGIGLILLTLNLVRTDKLYVGYAVMWASAVSGLMILVSVPSLLAFVTVLVGAIFPASAISLLAFVFIFIVLIFFSVELSILSSRQVKLAQSLALNELLGKEQQAEPEGRKSSETRSAHDV
jgi:hypothetical protein